MCYCSVILLCSKDVFVAFAAPACVGGEQLYSIKYQTHQSQRFKQGLKIV